MQYKLFGKSGLRVSELCLGTMTFGTEWGTGTDYAGSKAIFDAFVEAGGNFFDTANRYTEGTSERWLGEFIAHDRDAFVIATKYSLYERSDTPTGSGNSRSNLRRTVEKSLQRLKTDYIDLLWLHAWDFTTPVEEVMRSLDDLITAGKVHYIGISDTPAWIVARANTLSELRGWAAFVGLQVEYSLIERTPERELLPMAQAFGMSVTPWSPIGAGLLTGKYNNGIPEAARLSAQSKKLTPKNLETARLVGQIAQELGIPPVQVALRWVMAQSPSMIPIVGARRVDQLRESLGVCEQDLDPEHLQQLNAATAIPLGFPHEFLASDHVRKLTFGDFYDKIQY
ncbi:MAG: aldo/keto reductase [Bernardetiaceae bacterium]